MEQAVFLTFRLSDSGFGSDWEQEILGSLGDDLAEAVTEADVGEFDGNDVGQGEYTLFLYGPDADELFEAIRPILDSQTWPAPIVAVKRYGPPGAAETRFTIGGRS